MKIAVYWLTSTLVLLSACSGGPDRYPSPEGKSPPYILKEDCSFTIVDELSTAGVSSPEVSGMEGASAAATVSLGEMSITVSGCEVTDNSHSLPIYEE